MWISYYIFCSKSVLSTSWYALDVPLIKSLDQKSWTVENLIYTFNYNYCESK